MDCCEQLQSMPIAAAHVVCPKPRRPGRSCINTPSKRSCRFHIRNDDDSRSSGEFIRKIDFKVEGAAALSSSPQFLYGSPPCRASNPLIHDAHLGDENVTSILKSASESCLMELAYSKEQSSGKIQALRYCPTSDMMWDLPLFIRAGSTPLIAN